MIDEAAPTPGDLGVVDPIRPPASAVRFGNRVRQLPAYALAFLLLAVAGAIVDIATALGGISPGVGASPLLGLVLGALPGWVVLLVPAAVAWATQTTGSASRRVVRGSIAIGLSEVGHIAANLMGISEPSGVVAYAVVEMVAWLLLALGLIWLANGMEAVRRQEPTPVVQRIALGVVVIGVLAAVLDLGTRLIQLGGADLRDEYDAAIFFTNVTGLAYIGTLLGWTFLARALLRGGGDAGRPRAATRAGAVAGWLAGLWLLGSLLSVVAFVPFVAATDPEILARPPWGDVYLLVAVAARACSVLAIVYLAWGLRAGLGSEGGSEAAE